MNFVIGCYIGQLTVTGATTNENTEVALRSQNFITEPLSRLEMGC